MSAEKYFDRISSIGKLRPIPSKEPPFQKYFKQEPVEPPKLVFSDLHVSDGVHAAMGADFDKLMKEVMQDIRAGKFSFKPEPQAQVKAARVPCPKPGCKKCGGSGKRRVQLLTSVVFDPCDCVS